VYAAGLLKWSSEFYPIIGWARTTSVSEPPSFRRFPEGCRQGVEDPYRLCTCSGSHWGFNLSLIRPEQPAWASLHLSGGFPRGAVKV